MMSATSVQSPILRIFEEAFNQGTLEIVDELLSSDHTAHNAFGGALNVPQGLKCIIAVFRSAFPDLHCTLEDEIMQGDKVAAHWTMRGTHEGIFLGNQATGRQIDVKGILFAHVFEGQIVEIWMLIDQFGLLQQLGIVPPPHRLNLKYNQQSTLSVEKDENNE